MPSNDAAHHAARVAERLMLATLAVGFSAHAALGGLPQAAAAAALIGKMSMAGLCFAYAKAREREPEACDAIVRAGEAMLSAARYFMLAMAAQFLADKVGIANLPYLGPPSRVGIAAFYLLAFARFIKGFDELGGELRRREGGRPWPQPMTAIRGRLAVRMNPADRTAASDVGTHRQPSGPGGEAAGKTQLIP